MPTVRKPIARLRLVQIRPEHWAILWGEPYPQGGNLFLRHSFLQAVPLYWAQHGEEILTRWIADHPGTRPWYWWRAIAPAPRRMVADGMQESQAAFLARLNLLQPGELVRLRPADMRPEPLPAFASDPPEAA